MTAKEYLQQIQRNDIKINQLIKEAEDLRKSIVFISGIDYTKDRVQASPDSSTGPMKTIERWYDLERDIEKRIDQHVRLKHKIIQEIQSLKKSEYSEILYMRYVNYMSLEEIACSLKYSYYRVAHLHGEALQAFVSTCLEKVSKR